MNYVIYNKETGDIVQHGSCPPDCLPKNLPAHLEAMEGKGTDLGHEVKAGKIVARAPGVIAARKAADEAASRPAAGPKGKLERILAHLKRQGIDLGPAGADL